MTAITHKDGTAAAILARNMAEQASAEAKQAQKTADTALAETEENAEDLAQAVLDINSDISNLQDQVDGNITSWFYTVDPSTSTPPASDWTTDEEKSRHVGDLYYNTASGYTWRWVYMSNVYGWEQVVDTAATQALAIAQTAQDTADHKRRIFFAQPTPPYDAGDMWVNATYPSTEPYTYQNDMLRCTTHQDAPEDGGAFSISHWTLASKYTDNTRADEAYGLAYNSQQTANGKNRVYYDSQTPTGGTYAIGDIWFDTAHDNQIHRYNGSTWPAVTLGDGALTSLSADKLTAGSIDASQITVSNLDAANITVNKIQGNQINMANINVGDFHDDGTYVEPGDNVSILNDDGTYANPGDNISIFTNNGTYCTGRLASVTTHTREVTYATASGYVGTENDSWSSVTAFSGSAGDLVLIPFTITDRDNASAVMLCRVRSYSGTTLYTDNLSLEMDAPASKYVTKINPYDGITVHDAGDSSNFANVNSNGMTIYQSGSEAAHFRSTDVSLGNGSANAEIKLCGEQFYLYGSNSINGQGAKAIVLGNSSTDSTKSTAISSQTLKQIKDQTSNAIPSTYDFSTVVAAPVVATMQSFGTSGSKAALLGVFGTQQQIFASVGTYSGNTMTGTSSAVLSTTGLTVNKKLTAGAINANGSDSIFAISSEDISVSASDTGASANDVPISKSGGWYPLGVVGESVVSGGASSRGFYISGRSVGSARLYARIHVTSTTVNPKNCTAYVLWAKVTA